MQADEKTIAKALTGDYRREHLFALRQSVAAYRQYQQLLRACDQEIEAMLEEFSDGGPAAPIVGEPKRERGPRGNELRFDLKGHLYRIFGVDLTQVPGISAMTAHMLLTEAGRDLSAFRSGPAFASWLGLCPDNRISGGKVLSAHTRKVKHRLSKALRLAAQSLHGSKSWLGHEFRRMRAKTGAPKAITAMAHKLARIVFHLITTKQAYDETVFAQREIEHTQRTRKRLEQQARALGMQLVEKITA